MAYGLRKVEAVAEGITWEEVKNKLETEGAKNKAYDSDVDGVLDLAVIPVITRSKLEYPTEDVTFAYLAAIDKAFIYYFNAEPDDELEVYTADDFTDKAVEGFVEDASGNVCGRWSDVKNSYFCDIATSESTGDFRLVKLTGGTVTILAKESVDLNSGIFYRSKISIAGSTLKGYRMDMTTEKISATDTDHASGKYGHGGDSGSMPIALGGKLLAPSSPLTKPKSVVEAEVIGSGTEEDPFRPNLKQELSKHNKFGNIDKLSVTWGAFDHKEQHNTMLICITGGNQYTGEKAIQEQIEHAKRKNLKVLKLPKDYHEAVRQYKELKKEFPEWIAGCHNYCYAVLGHEDFEAMQVADTYHGRIIDMGDTKAYKNVPEFEMRRTLAMWKERLKRAKVMKQEAQKHIEKIEKVERVGW